MGAWGHLTFENDSALDWLGALTDEGVPLIREVLEGVVDQEQDDEAYLEVDDASSVLAAAELVAAALGKGDDRLHEDAAEWLQGHRAEVRKVGAALARKAVECVYENSELRELWDESGEDTEWHEDVRELLERLS